MKKSTILFVHPLSGNAYQLFKAFERNESVSITPLITLEEKAKQSILYKIRYKLKIQQDIYNINKKLLKYNFENTTILFIVKGNEVFPSTLKTIKQRYPQLQIVNWSLDDMYAWHNRSLFYTFSLKFYDHVFTTKSYNMAELPNLGAKKIHYINQAYSKDIHKPNLLCIDQPKYDVCFIGFPENERFSSLQYLAHNNIKVDIFGYESEWKKPPYNNSHPNLNIHFKSVYGNEYAETISSAKICLCFLRKINRDLHTSRSVEIPACGGFMIAERTSEHSDLFIEDKEAVYFSSDHELLEKILYYLNHDNERKSIAEAGLMRCQTSGYSYDDMAEKILESINV